MAAFTKGDIRINRKGRPRKGTSITDILSYQLDQKDETGTLRREKIAEQLIKLAESGDIAAIRYLADRLDGRPRESIELTTNAIDIQLKEIFDGQK
jgi:hypothetical protein